MKIAAIIVAAGRGTRAGGELPKQWQDVAGKPLVVAREDQELVDRLNLSARVTIAIGAAERSQSVLQGLKATDADYVLIHDAARCCCPFDVIERVLDALVKDGANGAAPALGITDALWRGKDAHVVETVDRNSLYAAQTPQGFKTDLIRKAHLAYTAGAADDVEIARSHGLGVTIVPGDIRNLKITTPEDFARAAKILDPNMTSIPDIRTGNGFDVHRFGEGDHVVLCGVKVPHSHGLQGHSDADVGMHTVTDAIYGALCRGDIGQHFPPSDPQWKGAASDIFLRHACAMARDMGFTMTHVDCTLICEFPKIGPVAQAMRDQMAEIMELDVDRVSIKATTSERLGFTGRGEGIAALATVTLVTS